MSVFNPPTNIFYKTLKYSELPFISDTIITIHKIKSSIKTEIS